MSAIETSIFPEQKNTFEELLASGFDYTDDLKEDLEELERRVWRIAVLSAAPPRFMGDMVPYRRMRLLSVRASFDTTDGQMLIVGHGAWNNPGNVRLLIDEIVRIVSQAFHVKNVKSYNYRHIIVVGHTHL